MAFLHGVYIYHGIFPLPILLAALPLKLLQNRQLRWLLSYKKVNFEVKTGGPFARLEAAELPCRYPYNSL